MASPTKSPESLLQALLKEEKTLVRGKLKLFLGMCPGVGKTYAMLETAQYLQKKDTKIVVGLVETHNRSETKELLKGLKLIPLKSIQYRGVTIKEMDLDALLTISPRPDIILVDELAHQNAPDSRHLKRYQDVEELLAQGFNVYSTLNIQHIESLNDKVAQITGVVVQETIPDSFFDLVTEVELIDISPQELLTRLNEGKVYLGDRAQRAKENFFQEEKLTALRELALRYTADLVEQSLSHQMSLKGLDSPWKVNEKFLVAVSSKPDSSRLIRAARRMAYIMDAPWIALNIDTAKVLSSTDQKSLQQNLNLAQELGADVISVANTNMVQAILKVCEDRNVTQIILGRPHIRWWEKIIGSGSIIDQLINAKKNIDIHILPSTPIKKKWSPGLLDFKFVSKISNYVLALLYTASISAIGYLILPIIGQSSLVAIFILALLFLSIKTNLGPSLFSAAIFAVISYFSFNYAPLSSSFIKLPQNFFLVFYFIAAFIFSTFHSQIIRQERLMADKDSRFSLLYEFNKKINNAVDINSIISSLKNIIKTVFNANSTIYFADNKGQLNLKFNELGIDEKNKAVVLWSYTNKEKAGKFTTTLSGADIICYPLIDNNDALGILVIKPLLNKKHLTIEENSILSSITNQAANAISKLNLSLVVKNNADLDDNKKIQETIISSLKNKILPSSESLLQTLQLLKLDDNSLLSIKTKLSKISQIIISYLNNVIEYYRLETTEVDLQLEKFTLAKLFNDIYKSLPLDLGNRSLIINTDKSLSIIADYNLLKTALSNLIDNAVKYSTGNIYVDWFIIDNKIHISIKDEGNYKTQKSSQEIANDNNHESGIGLQIANQIINLHQGQIRATNLNNHLGLDISIKLPISN